MLDGNVPEEETQAVKQMFQQEGYFSHDSRTQWNLSDGVLFCLILQNNLCYGDSPIENVVGLLWATGHERKS